MGTVIAGISDPIAQNIRALIFGTRWDTGSVVTYDFPDSFADYGAYSHTTSGFTQVPLHQRTAVRLIIEGEDGIVGLATAGTIFKYGSFESVAGINANDQGAFSAADISSATVLPIASTVSPEPTISSPVLALTVWSSQPTDLPASISYRTTIRRSIRSKWRTLYLPRLVRQVRWLRERSRSARRQQRQRIASFITASTVTCITIPMVWAVSLRRSSRISPTVSL